MRMLGPKVLIVVTMLALSGGGLLVAGVATPANPKPPQAVLIVSPAHGIFHASPYPGAPPYVTLGSQVEPMTVVCRVDPICTDDASTPMDVVALVRGVIVEVLATDGQIVQFEQPLFRVQVKTPVP